MIKIKKSTIIRIEKNLNCEIIIFHNIIMVVDIPTREGKAIQ